jgi:hypothetical protein
MIVDGGQLLQLLQLHKIGVCGRMVRRDSRGGIGIDKNLRKNVSSNINLKYGSCRYVHAE